MDYLSEYNSEWPDWFDQIDRYLRPYFVDCLRIEHVGSTSIVGMVAKPIIDIDIVVEVGHMASAISCAERAGYAHCGDQGVSGREAFKPISAAPLGLPRHHLYACEESAFELRNHVSFRDYLIVHPLDAARLAEHKLWLAFERKLSRAEYIVAKEPFVSAISDDALAWYATLPGET